MSFLELAKQRYSVRDYLDKKIEEEKLQKILQSAHVAPTAANSQSVRLIVVKEKEGLDKISKAANIYHAPTAIIACSYADKAWERPFDGKISSDIDASILTAHIMMEATDLGIGSVWICRFKPDVIKEEFNLPDNLEPINILALGYADESIRKTSKHHDERIAMDELIRYETF